MPLTQIDSHAALLVIDLQQGIVAIPCAHPMTEIVARAAALAAAFRAAGQTVVLINVIGGAPGRTEQRRTAHSFPEGWDQLAPELHVATTDLLVSKQRAGAFLGTDLAAQLAARGVTQVFLCGVSTSMGVESTARSAFDLGLHVVFVTDAMTDRSLETHDFYVEQIFPREGERATAAQVLAQLPA